MFFKKNKYSLAIAMFSKAIELGNKDAQKYMEEENLI